MTDALRHIWAMTTAAMVSGLWPALLQHKSETLSADLALNRNSIVANQQLLLAIVGRIVAAWHIAATLRLVVGEGNHTAPFSLLAAAPLNPDLSLDLLRPGERIAVVLLFHGGH